ncbi:DUF1540 domain-containing protein [Acetohalobium arabaticum]|uniref:DUF1540 domain-containing protein n=1 Tax=Acetohalobium arabaticum (strain ATCC 49924 / DSM 5501 / Z-7288) TaxID=574087 RepID=D9QQ82_ACEAZ|nr:DUF1540 domain-containing protein [Acetohalobium arabaticum]ADL12673.1 protein of unknown function DUF1540 [Acetohalobium arabaticum DSM 5501]
MGPKSHVHCTVENCKWFEEPNLCVAEKILITSDDFSKELPNEMDVEETNQIVNQKGLSPITECYQSNCKTFVPEDKYDQGLGGTNPNNPDQ